MMLGSDDDDSGEDQSIFQQTPPMQKNTLQEPLFGTTNNSQGTPNPDELNSDLLNDLDDPFSDQRTRLPALRKEESSRSVAEIPSENDIVSTSDLSQNNKGNPTQAHSNNASVATLEKKSTLTIMDDLADAIEEDLPKENEKVHVETINRIQEFLKQISERNPENLPVTVSNPTKLGDTLSAYIVYDVCKENSDSVVQRRYSEFLWLRKVLVAKYPGIIIPLCPDKNAIGRFEPLFIEQRRRGLENFLVWVATDAVLCTSDVFHQFCSEHSTFNGDLISNETKYSYLMRTMNPAFKNRHFGNSGLDVLFDNQELQAIKLDKILKALHDVYSHLLTNEEVLITNHKENADLFNKIKAHEDHVNLAKRFGLISTAFADVSSLKGEDIAVHIHKIQDAIAYLIAVNGAAKEQLRQRQKIRFQLEDAKENLSKRRAAEQKCKDQNRLDKLQALAIETAASASRVEGLTEYLEKFKDRLVSDLSKINNFRGSHISLSLMDFLKKAVAIQKKTVERWEQCQRELAT